MGLGSTCVFQVHPAVLSRIQGRLSFWSILASSPRMCTCSVFDKLLAAVGKAETLPPSIATRDNACIQHLSTPLICATPQSYHIRL